MLLPLRIFLMALANQAPTAAEPTVEPVVPTTATESTAPSSDAAPLPAAKKLVLVRTPRVLFMDLEAVSVDAESAKLINGVIGQALARTTSFELTTSGDIRQLTSLESNRQTMGCSTASCLAEIAGALDVEFVVFGSVGKLGDTILVQLNLFDARGAKPVAREEVTTTDIGALPNLLRPASARLVASLLRENDPLHDAMVTPAAVVVVEEESSTLSSSLLYGGAAVAALAGLAVVGGVGIASVAAVVLMPSSPIATDAAGKNGAKLVGQISTAAIVVAGITFVVGAALLGTSFAVE